VSGFFERERDRDASFMPPEWSESRTTDQHGEASLPVRIPVPLGEAGIYAIRQDKDRPLVGVHRLTREAAGKPATIVMHPACRVRLRVECPGFRELEAQYRAELGGPHWERAAYVLLGEGGGTSRLLFTSSTTGELEFLLPPGRFTIEAFGADVNPTKRLVEIGPRHRVRSLGIVEVTPSRGVVNGVFHDLWRSTQPDGQDRFHRPRLGPALRGETQGVQDLAFSPDGKLLATAHAYNDGPGTVKLWRVQTGALAATLPVSDGEDGVDDLAFAPDGQTVAGSVRSMHVLALPSTIVLWDFAGRRAPRVLRGHTAAVIAVAFAPDGQTLASGSADRTVRFWEVASARETGRIKVAPEWPLAIAYTPDGKTLALASGVALKLWDIPGNRLRAALEPGGFWVHSLAFAPDGRTLAASGSEVGPNHQVGAGQVRLYSMDQDPPARRATLTLNAQAHPRANLGQNVFGDLVFTPDGRRVIALAGPTIAIWDATTGAELHSFERNFQNPTDRLAVAPDGRWLAVTGIIRPHVRLIDISPPPPAP
jgi:Tol biopolymer transport system component